MKHLNLTLLPIIFFGMMGAKALAYDAEIDGIYYDFSGTEATVTHELSNYPFYTTSPSTIDIPATVTYSGNTYRVTSIGEAAFASCKDLTSVTIPSSVTSIGVQAFESCSSLTSITINGVTSIGASAFYDCWGLTKAEFASIENFCNMVFENYDSNPLYFARHLYIDGQEVTDLVIPNGTTTIGNYAFIGCRGLTSVTIPEGVTSIGIMAFQSCSGLTSITIPNSVTTIGFGAFRYCSCLTSIPENLTDVGSGAFDGTEWQNNQPDGLVYAGKVAYLWKGEMPENTEVVLKDGTKSNTAYAFNGCRGLASITIPEGVTSIGAEAFRGCHGLTSITIPKSVTSIGEGAFNKCSNLTTIICLNPVPPIVNSYIFTSYSATLYVPYGCKEAYQNANVWKNFKNIEELDAPTGIQGFTLNKDEYARTYDLNGRKVSRMKSGVNILLMSDGTTKKVVVK